MGARTERVSRVRELPIDLETLREWARRDFSVKTAMTNGLGPVRN